MPTTAPVPAEVAPAPKILYRGHCPATADSIVPRTNREHLLVSRIAELVDAVQWALGCSPDGFEPRQAGNGAYWWRRELQSRARVLPRMLAEYDYQQPVQVIASAVKTADGHIFSVPRPGRHCHVVQQMVAAGVVKTVIKHAVHGFLITGGTFVDRCIAAKIAYGAGQLLHDRHLQKTGLRSVDVW